MELSSIDVDPRVWPGLELIEAVEGGHRNTVWRGRLAHADVAVRRSRRSVASLDWELDVLEALALQGVIVPEVIRTSEGDRHHEGIVVQRWLHGRPPSSEDDWKLVAEALQSIHQNMGTYPQRPGCCTVLELVHNRVSVDADLDAIPVEIVERMSDIFEEFVDVPTALIHGDPMDGNIRIDEDGAVGFLDWDESRVDLVWHDLSNLGVQVLDDDEHARAQRLSNCWEAANAWTAEPTYARTRLAALQAD